MSPYETTARTLVRELMAADTRWTPFVTAKHTVAAELAVSGRPTLHITWDEGDDAFRGWVSAVPSVQGAMDRGGILRLAERLEGLKKAQPAPVPDSWPDSKGWAHDAAAFLALVQAHPMAWTMNSRIKYLRLNVDTRDGAFRLHDRDGNELTPVEVLAAVRESRERFGSRQRPGPRGRRLGQGAETTTPGSMTWADLRERFEEHATGRGLDLTEHPLHALYTDRKTQEAWMGWRAAHEALGAYVAQAVE